MMYNVVLHQVFELNTYIEAPSKEVALDIARLEMRTSGVVVDETEFSSVGTEQTETLNLFDSCADAVEVDVTGLYESTDEHGPYCSSTETTPGGRRIACSEPAIHTGPHIYLRLLGPITCDSTR